MRVHRPVKRRLDGYTLTEMLVVIAIIGLLAAVLAPNLIGNMGRAKARSARLQLETVSAGLEMHLADVGRYPTAEEGLQGLLTSPTDILGWTGPYVRDISLLTDPWGRPLTYSPGADALSYRVVSLGADGVAGGSGLDADIAVPPDDPMAEASTPAVTAAE